MSADAKRMADALTFEEFLAIKQRASDHTVIPSQSVQDRRILVDEVERITNQWQEAERELFSKSEQYRELVLRTNSQLEGAARACSGLRREVAGVNSALRNSQARVRLLQAIDRDPEGVTARLEIERIRKDSLWIAKQLDEKERELRAVRRDLADARARQSGMPDALSVEAIRLAEAAASDPANALSHLHEMMLLLKARRENKPWPPEEE